MEAYKIHVPIWNGGKRCVGIADFRLQGTGNFYIEITTINKAGDRIYPEIFYIDKALAKTFEVQARKGIRLYIIPISELKTKGAE